MIAPKGNIVFSKDLIKKVAKDKNLSEKQVTILFDFYFKHYFKNKALEPEVFTINLPYIGKLYLKTRAAWYSIIRSKRKDKRLELLEEKLQEFELEFSKHIDENDCQPYSIHNAESYLNRFYYNAGMDYEALENHQNTLEGEIKQ